MILFVLDCDDVPDYEKKRLENIDAKQQYFNAKLQGTISALKAKPPKPFQCSKCPSSYMTEDALNQHQCLYCEICKMTFKQSRLLFIHRSKVHGKELKVENVPLLECNIFQCSEKFNNYNSIKKHIESIHFVMCNVCNEDYKVHPRNKHNCR